MRLTPSAALLAAALLLPAAVFAKPLVVCTEASPDGFDVVQYNALTTTNASADVIFNGLVAFDEARHEVVPALATHWEASADGLSYTFHLRGGVAFQTTSYFKPTRPFDADDVVFSFSRMLDPANPWHKVAGPGGFPHAHAMQLDKLIKSIVSVDAHTVRIDLNYRDATFLPLLTMGFASIYSAEYANLLLKAGKTAQLNAEPIGTGPFQLRRYQKDAMIRYDVNPSYWGPKPKIDKLIYAITPDAAVRVQKVEAGECQIALSPKPQDIQLAKTNKSLSVVQTPAFMTAFVAINTQHKPLDNPKVRQAINLAFDRATYLKTVFDDTAKPAVNPYPPNTWSYAKGIAAYPHDIARAKQLLAEAGYPNGFSTTIWTRPSGSVLNPNPKVGAELFQADLAKIGIKAQVQVIEWGELIRNAKQGQHDLLFMGWAGDNGDPDNFLTPQFSCAAVQSGTNFARYCDKTLDKDIADAKLTDDRASRSHLYDAAQRMIHEEALWVPLGYPVASAITSNTVSGYTVSPFGRQDFSNVVVH